MGSHHSSIIRLWKTKAKTLMFVNCSPASSNLDETFMFRSPSFLWLQVVFIIYVFDCSGCLLFVVCLLFVCWLFVVCCLLFVVCCLLFVVCCLLFVVCCLLFVVCCLLFVVCCCCCCCCCCGCCCLFVCWLGCYLFLCFFLRFLYGSSIEESRCFHGFGLCWK